ncbi:peptidylprolyl isomerase [Mesorhizobium retamae]|uniref:Parvulin-like PPIase n=1 Tax=Mesorhizobium retamae TaxID=2912854 RepID=A0ABS9QB26_9HYPH|nr:peptidylprolyl isomerase [Mesorhizobium sp. IRAMC:0171]MCG7504603.1 peptidylprolyl isomerase [Mesorhizobium sp. IRAMC:0171]
MSLLSRRASLASLGLAVGLSALSLSPLAAQETQPAKPADAAAAPAPAPVDPNAVIATVDGKPITEADLTLAEGELSRQFAQLPPEQRRAAALSAAIEIKVLAAKAVADGLDKDPEFQRRSAFLQQRALHGELVEKEVVGKITEEEIRARYDKEIAAQPPVNEVHARHILVKTKEEADAIVKKLDAGEDFQKLANENTSDPSGKTNGGDLGFFGPGQMVPEFEKAAMALEVGKYTKDPVQTQFGWHIIKVEDKRQQQPPAFDQVKEQAKSAVVRDKYFAAVKEARKAAKVEIPDETLRKAVEAAEGGAAK